jgi:sugar lactone lactonase YvrE
VTTEQWKTTLTMLAAAFCGIFLFNSSVAEATPIVVVPGYTIELVATGAIAVDGLIVGTDGFIYMTDYAAGRVLRVSAAAHNGIFEVFASGLANPTDLTLTPDGRMFVTASLTGDIVEVTGGTASIFASGFPTATSINFANGLLIVTNSSPGTITATDLSGHTTTLLSGIYYPYGATVGPNGTLYFIEFLYGTIYRTDLSGTPPILLGTASATGAQFTTIDALGTLYIGDPLAKTLWRLDASGQLSSFASQFTGKANLPVTGPSGLAFDAQGTLYVGDGPNLWRIAPIALPQAPTADAGPDQTLVADLFGTARVQIVGQANPAESSLSSSWTEGTQVLSRTNTADVSLKIGMHVLTLTVIDQWGRSASDSVNVGVQLPTSAAGPEGPIGATGPAGPQGATGPAGPQGPIGATGATGPAGPAGPDGIVGPQGAAGSPGATGPQGSQGLKGDTGAIGATGPQGVTGPVGPVGPQGAAGLDVPPGTTILLAVGTPAPMGYSLIGSTVIKIAPIGDGGRDDKAQTVTFNVFRKM